MGAAQTSRTDMTAIPQGENVLTLPRSIRSLLRQIALRQWWVGALVGLLQTLTLALVALLAGALVLGFEPKLWTPVRILVAAIVWVMGLRSLIFLIQPVLRMPSLTAAARHAECRFPHLQERLSSTVELIRETEPTFAGSHALIRHLMLQAQSDAASLRAAQVVST